MLGTGGRRGREFCFVGGESANSVRGRPKRELCSWARQSRMEHGLVHHPLTRIESGLRLERL